jgi:MYXO-CTERM domain-containing protein
LLVAGLVLFLLGAAGRADAGIVIYVEQVGSDVVTTGGGAIDLTGLGSPTTGANQNAGITPNIGFIALGPTSAVNIDIYHNVTGPSSWGAVGGSGASSGSGNLFGAFGLFGELLLPQGYTSGTNLSATDTYSGTTLAGLGFSPIPATYTYTWGTGGPTHTLTLDIGTTPEPASLAIWSLSALGLAVGGAWRRRKSLS